MATSITDTLAASTVATKTLTGAGVVRVTNQGTVPIYVIIGSTVNGNTGPATPTVGGDGTAVVAAGGVRTLSGRLSGDVSVKLISAGTPTYTIERVSSDEASSTVTEDQMTAAIAAAVALCAPKRFTITADETGDYATQASDVNSSKGINKATAVTVTFTPDVHAVGDAGEFRQAGAGTITFAFGPGVTPRSARSAYRSGAQYAVIGWECVAANTISLSGDLKV